MKTKSFVWIDKGNGPLDKTSKTLDSKEKSCSSKYSDCDGKIDLYEAVKKLLLFFGFLVRLKSKHIELAGGDFLNHQKT